MIVMEELAGQPVVRLWMAVKLPFGRAAARRGADVPRHVIRDEEVQPAIVIVIQPACRNCPHRAELGIDSGDTGMSCDVDKLAVPQIAVEYVAFHARDEDIGMA